MSNNLESQVEFVACYACANKHPVGNMEECHGELYCETCASLNIRTCTDCGERYNQEEDGAWGGRCPPCAVDYFTCENCDGIYHSDDYGGDGRCVDCYEDEENRSIGIRAYHQSPSYTFHPSGETLYFGVELETDGYSSRSRATEDLYELSNEEDIFFMEEDGSLNNGIEIISQPCSLDYHKHIFPWEKITDVVGEHGGKSHNTTTCGLHIHFSRATFEGRRDKLYQIRLVYFFEKFWAKMVKFSRREGNWEYNAQKYNIPIYDKPASAKLRDIKQSFYRYQAVNLVNRETIEIRIFRGSLKVSTILASLELVDFLIRLVKKISNQELQAMTWTEVIKRVKHSKYEYLYPYLKAIGLVEGGQNVLDSREA